MKERGRLYKKEKVTILKDVFLKREDLRNGKIFKEYFEENEAVNLMKLKKFLSREYNLTRSKTGLLISWSIRDQITPSECYQKYLSKFL